MSVYKKKIGVLYTCPKYDVVERDSHNLWLDKERGSIKVVELEGCEEIAMMMPSGRYKTFTISSVVSSAIKSNECPFEAIRRAEHFGHDLYFIYGHSVCISVTETEREEYIGVDVDTLYHFQGKVFRIAHTNNNNLRLVIHEQQPKKRF